jgi:hypothetical protein
MWRHFLQFVGAWRLSRRGAILCFSDDQSTPEGPASPGKLLTCLWKRIDAAYLGRDCRRVSVACLPLLTGLREVHLWGVNCEGDIGAALRALPGLELVSLHDLPVTDEAICVLSLGGQIRELDCVRLPITDTGVACIGRMVRLELLSIEGSQVRGEGIGHLRCLGALRYLGLTQMAIGDERLGWIPELGQLETLNLCGTRVGDWTACRIGQMRSLRFVLLDDTMVTDVGVEAVAALPALESLTISGCAVTDSSLGALARARALQWLGLNNTDVSRRAYEWFCDARPEVRTFWSERRG